MIRIYLYEGSFGRGEEGYPLIRRAAADHCLAEGIIAENDGAYEDIVNNEDIKVYEKGKPYFPSLPVHFSLSHSRQMWMCAFGPRPLGIDIQQVTDCRWESISRRFYTEGEQHQVAMGGIEGFFDVWVRKEALAKATGEGLFGGLPGTAGPEGELLPLIGVGDTLYRMQGIELLPDLRCALCTEGEEEEETEVRLLT